MMGKLVVALAIAFFCTAAFAQGTDWFDLGTPAMNWAMGSNTPWWQLSILAVAAMLVAITMIYMLGYAMHLENVKRWAMAEFLQLLASSFMLICLTSLLLSTFTLITEKIIGEESTVVCAGQVIGGTQSGGINPVQFFLCKTQEKITALDNMYNQVFKANMADEFSMSVIVNIAGWPIYFGESEYRTKVEQNHLIGEKITELLVSLHGQYALMEYINNNMLTLFLPIGLFLRLLPMTRGIGGLFIAIAIGFYIVFPTLFLLNDPSFVKAVAAPGAMDTSGNCVAGFSGLATTINKLPSGGAGAGGAASTAQIGKDIAKLTIDIMFFPFIAFAITLIFVRTAAPIFGGDASDMMRMTAKVT